MYLGQAFDISPMLHHSCENNNQSIAPFQSFTYLAQPTEQNRPPSMYKNLDKCCIFNENQHAEFIDETISMQRETPTYNDSSVFGDSYVFPNTGNAYQIRDEKNEIYS